MLESGLSPTAGHYLYGSTPEVLSELEAAIAARWPAANVVGSESPPFRELTDDEIEASVRRAEALGATIVWVGMGTPKQDLLVHRMAAMSDITFVAIGAAFDFIAGTKSQAPRWVMRIGMEWFYRLVTEPRRLWKRYLVYNTKFIRLLWRSRHASLTCESLSSTTNTGPINHPEKTASSTDDVDALRKAGLDVEVYLRSSDEIADMPIPEKLALPIRPTYSRTDAKALSSQMKSFRPDIVHVHNVFPLISPHVVTLARRHGARVVQTVHNYRHTCASGILFRDGRLCTDCVGRRVAWPSVAHACYRGSRPQSAAMAVSLAIRPSTWRLVDLFLPVGQTVADNLQAFGIDPERIMVRPNVVPDPGPATAPRTDFAYVGRLTTEKGVLELVDAWSRSEARTSRSLRIAGDGPLRPLVVERSAADPTIQYHGLLEPAAVTELIAEIGLLVACSIWPEPDPLTAISAMAAGRAVLGSNRGAFVSYIDDTCGWLSEPSAPALATVLSEIHRSPQEIRRRGQGARQRYERDRLGSVPTLDDVYERLLARP